MQKRGFQARGFIKNGAATCIAVLLSAASMTSHALPSKFDIPPCNSNGACYNAITKHQQDGGQEQTNPVEEAEASAPLNEFGEVVYPDVDESISQAGSSTLALGAQDPDAVTGTYNDIFDYVGQTSQQGEQIARLELEELAAKAAETSWTNSIPVPEPATAALMGLGILGLILLSRRGRSKG